MEIENQNQASANELNRSVNFSSEKNMDNVATDNGMTKKILKWTILIVILVVVVIAVLLFLSNIFNIKQNKNIKTEDTVNVINNIVDIKPSTATNIKVILANTFKDNALGYEIKYPEDWIYKKEEDIKNNSISIIFTPEKESPLSISVTKFDLNNIKSLNPKLLSDFIGMLQKKVKDKNGVYSGVEDYIYKFSDGTILNGKQFGSEIMYKTLDVKQQDIVVQIGQNLFWVDYSSKKNIYSTLQETANAMLGSWIIKKQ